MLILILDARRVFLGSYGGTLPIRCDRLVRGSEIEALIEVNRSCTNCNLSSYLFKHGNFTGTPKAFLQAKTTKPPLISIISV